MIINCSYWDMLSISLTSVINLAPSNVYCLPGWYAIEISCWSNPDGDIESMHAGLLCCLYAQRVNTVYFFASVFVVVCNFDQVSSKTFWNLSPPAPFFFCKYLLPTEEHPSEFFARLIHAALPPSLLKKHSDLSWNGFSGGKRLTNCNVWLQGDQWQHLDPKRLLLLAFSCIYTSSSLPSPPSALAHFQF